jgi:hypothetical protein
MEDGTARSAEEIAAAIGYVCGDPEQLRDVLPGDERALVDQVLANALNGPLETAKELLDRLHVALRRAGDPRGVYGQVLRKIPWFGRGTAPLGSSTARPAETIYLCPIGRCTRFWFPDGRSRADVPNCSASGVPLAADGEPL